MLDSYDLAYETYGELNEDKSNAIVVFHALTGSHHAAGKYEGDSKPGWWDPLIGDDKILDTTKYFVICVNVIGSCFGSTSPLSINKKKKTLRLKFSCNYYLRDMGSRRPNWNSGLRKNFGVFQKSSTALFIREGFHLRVGLLAKGPFGWPVWPVKEG